jgi:hypothetical protein
MYLPKAVNKYRPLGVPTIAWRLYLAMWLLPINGYLTPHPNQHGFIPTRGTLTAWRQVSSQVIPARNILEIDLKGFFPSVSPSMARQAIRILEKTEGKTSIMPVNVLQYLTDINYSKPSLPLGGEKIPEPYSISTDSIQHHSFNKLYDSYLTSIKQVYAKQVKL